MELTFSHGLTLKVVLLSGQVKNAFGQVEIAL